MTDHGWDPRLGRCICGYEAKSDKRAEQEIARHIEDEARES